MGLVQNRPGGLALLVILPAADVIEADPRVVPAVQRSRPHAILPHHEEPATTDLAELLRKPPSDLAASVTDYLDWRGLGVDRETVHLLRRIVDLSEEIRSVSALARGLYLSRRALGRRLMQRGLPVPSHWLQIGRLLRLTGRLQNSQASLFSVACESGYPDGFSLSNQMHRLTGYRPSQVREYLGWEWLLEAWLRKEAEAGGLAPQVAKSVTKGSRSSGARGSAPAAQPGRPRRTQRKTSA